VGRAAPEARFCLPIGERYGPDRDIEDLAKDYSRALESRVFRLLAPLDRVAGGPASLGDAVVHIDLVEIDLVFQYGVTDRLAVGVLIPYWYARART